MIYIEMFPIIIPTNLDRVNDVYPLVEVKSAIYLHILGLT